MTPRGEFHLLVVVYTTYYYYYTMLLLSFLCSLSVSRLDWSSAVERGWGAPILAAPGKSRRGGLGGWVRCVCVRACMLSGKGGIQKMTTDKRVVE